MANLPVGAPSWGNYFVFPLAFEKSGAGRAYSTSQPGNENRAAFFAEQKNGLWVVNLGGLKILATWIDQWDAFHDAVKGGWKPFLWRQESARFRIEREQPGGIGTGDGQKTTFQLVKTRSYPNGPQNRGVERVRFPHHNYPQIRIPSGNSSGQTLYHAGELVKIWVGGVEKFWGADWQIDRETGVVTFAVAPANGALVQAQCRFWIAVHGQDLYELELAGGSYQFPAGARLRQMPGTGEIYGGPNGEAI